MTKEEWVKEIRDKTEKVGTYNKAFEDVIDGLALVLEQRDEAYKQYLESGDGVCIQRTTAAGSSNTAKNPRVQIWMDLNAQALTYWKELGLTPAGLKKVNENGLKRREISSLSTMLSKLGQDMDGANADGE